MPELYRASDKVCSDCAALLEWAAAEKARQARKRSEVVSYFPWAPHALAYLYGANHGFRGNRGGDVQKAFYNLLLDLSHDVPESIHKGGKYGYGGGYFRGIKNERNSGYRDEPRAIDRRILGRLLALYKTIVLAVAAAQKDGLETGEHFTVRMAKGEITAADYNKQVLREEAR